MIGDGLEEPLYPDLIGWLWFLVAAVFFTGLASASRWWHLLFP